VEEETMALLKNDTLAIAIALVVQGCAGPVEDSVYTLVRGSSVDNRPGRDESRPPLRLHVATFDAADGAAYNSGNCETARMLFQQQPGVTVRFWCERGRFEE
jgi:hypothetical protein